MGLDWVARIRARQVRGSTDGGTSSDSRASRQRRHCRAHSLGCYESVGGVTGPLIRSLLRSRVEIRMSELALGTSRSAIAHGLSLDPPQIDHGLETIERNA
jgi:hypothetical protein